MVWTVFSSREADVTEKESGIRVKFFVFEFENEAQNDKMNIRNVCWRSIKIFHSRNVLKNTMKEVVFYLKQENIQEKYDAYKVQVFLKICHFRLMQNNLN